MVYLPAGEPVLPRDHLASEYDVEQTIEQQEEKVFDTSVHGQIASHLIITFNISGSGRYVDVSLMISLINDATGLCTVVLSPPLHYQFLRPNLDLNYRI